jgi:uncharacterized metal-binding protein
MNESDRVVIVPCSGIGKTYGTVTREAAYEVIEELRPQTTRLVSLSKLVMGDEAARTAIANNRVITIDGCALGCAAKMVDLGQGKAARTFAVLDVYRRHRHLKPRGIAELNEGGQQLACVLAGEVAAVVDDLQGGEDA